jgi:phosphoglycolate phosphatase
MKYCACLFDFDYTLVDSHIGIVKCFRIVLERHGFINVTDEEIQRTIGKTLENSFSILTGIIDKSRLAALRKEYVAEADIYMTANTHLFPDTVSTLNLLKDSGFQLGIISTKYRYRFMDLMNKYFPENFFDVLVGNEDITLPKPHPEGILNALKQLDIDAGKTVYVGDSTVDGETAQRAGVPFIGITTGVTPAEELRTYPHIAIVESLNKIPTLIS